MAKISIIVPVYKVEPYLHRCVDSILNQTFTDFELILVDDGSPDNCGQICDEYAEKDSRIHVIHQENKGQAAARNRALDWVFANSNSDYISFVDSDDWVHPRYLELLYLANKSFGTNISQCLLADINGSFKIPSVNERMFLISSEDQYIDWYSASFCDKMFSKKIWEQWRFPEMQIYEDVALWYKILFAEEKIALVKEVLYYYFINENGTVHSTWTPEKLSQVKAWEAQLEFFADYGHKRLLDSAVTHYYQILLQHLQKISASSSISLPEKVKNKYLIRRKLSKTIKQYKDSSYYAKNKYLILGNIFPKTMWAYWTAYGIKNKLSNLLKKGEK